MVDVALLDAIKITEQNDQKNRYRCDKYKTWSLHFVTWLVCVFMPTYQTRCYRSSSDMWQKTQTSHVTKCSDHVLYLSHLYLGFQHFFLLFTVENDSPVVIHVCFKDYLSHSFSEVM